MNEVTLLVPYRGHRRGEVTGEMDGLRYGILLTSGLTIYLYDDEFTYD